MKRGIHSLVLGVLCLLAAQVHSQAIRPVTDPDQAVEGFGFAVLPPNGSHWHVAIDSASATVAFGKKDPEHIRQRGSVLLAVTLFKASSDIATPDALRAELERAVRASSARYALTALTLEPYVDPQRATDCVRISAASEERDNPRRPGETLLLTISGNACRHALSPTHYVQATLSERRPIQSQALADERLKAESSRAIESITFRPMR